MNSEGYQEAVRKILLKANSSGDALAKILAEFKQKRPVASHAWICRKTGIRSRGYLSNVFASRNTLHIKYAIPLCGILELHWRHSLVLITLLIRDASGKEWKDLTDKLLDEARRSIT